MGYYFSIEDSQFFIKNENKEKALQHYLKNALSRAAFQKQEAPNTLEELFRLHQIYARVVDKENLEEINLINSITNRKTHKINIGDIIELETYNIKLIDQEELFFLLAPFVEDESELTCIGEDGELWKWLFKDGKLYEQEAQTSFSAPKLVQIITKDS